MPIRIHNTLTRRKEDFEPLDPKRVRFYVCGPTVYDFAHIGNARPVVVFDVLFRLLRHVYGAEHVTYVRNVTDVDDKIIVAAKENGEAIRDLTERTFRAYRADMAALGALDPDEQPRCTETIPQMVAMIELLIGKGYAYEAEGHVLFHVPSMENYGELSRRSLEDMIAGARVEVAPYKKHPADFVLWKPSTDDQPGWPSPWGKGRPGWHIECSAMAKDLLGETFDIHGGGIDLIFPHHENEIAQSRCAHDGAPLARYWMHNGFVQVNGEKMSKSLGNFFTVRELLEKGHRGEAIRLALLSGHYRQPIDITDDGLRHAKQQLDRLYGALRGIDLGCTKATPSFPVLAALEDDLNTPLALSHLYENLSALNRATTNDERTQLAGELRVSGSLLGLLEAEPETWFTATSDGIDAAEIEARIAVRNAARKARNFAEADRIRDALAKQGVLLDDGPTGTSWRRAD